MKVRVDLHKKEIKALMDCVSVTEESISNDVVMVSRKQMKRLDKINLDDLYIKLSNILFKNTFPGNIDE